MNNSPAYTPTSQNIFKVGSKRIFIDTYLRSQFLCDSLSLHHVFHEASAGEQQQH